MMDAYVIIGMPNTRKSTIISSLTGCCNRSVRDILLTSGKQIKTYVRTTGLQSVHTTSEEFLKEAMDIVMKCDSVLFSLWPKPHPVNPIKYPDALTYLNDLIIDGWNIKKVVVLDKESADIYRQFSVLAQPNSSRDPINKTAQAIRQHFEWV